MSDTTPRARESATAEPALASVVLPSDIAARATGSRQRSERRSRPCSKPLETRWPFAVTPSHPA